MKRFSVSIIVTLVVFFNYLAAAVTNYSKDDIYRQATQLMEYNDAQAYQELVGIMEQVAESTGKCKIN
jgi:hypothetical protein